MKLPDTNASETTSGIHKETIYWKWPYELEDGSDAEKAAYDKKDTQDSGKEVNMTITVTGTQTLEEPTPTLAELIERGEIKVGTYINYQAVKEEDVEALESYIPTSNEDTNKLKKYAYIAEKSKTDYTSDQKFKATNKANTGNENLKWRVLHVNEDGTADLIPNDSLGKLYLQGVAGFANAEEVLNAIGEVYGHGYGAIKGRSIKIEDIEKYSSFVPDYYSTDSNIADAQMIKVTNSNYNQQTLFKEITDEEGNITYGSEPTVIKKGDSITIKKTYYTRSNANTEKKYFQTDEKTKAAYDVIFTTKSGANKNTYWLASRCADPYSSYCQFYVRKVNEGYVGVEYSFTSSTGTGTFGSAVCPVVTIDSNTQMEQNATSGEWDLR